jgi:hypothetical protein
VIASVTAGVALLCILWSLWVRRDTWRNHYEMAATAGICCHGAALILIAPVTARAVGPLIYTLVGVWNLPAFVGHICYVAAGWFGAYNAIIRVTDGDGVRHASRIMAFIAGATAAAMSLFYVLGNSSRIPRDDFFTIPIGRWQGAYWLTLSCGVLYLILQGARALKLLRGDRRSHRVADINLLLVAIALAATTSWTVALATSPRGGWVMPQPMIWVVWTSVTVCGTALALTAGWSWRHKKARRDTYRAHAHR